MRASFNKSFNQRNGAFTLLEVALSIGILVVGLTAVVSVYITALSWTEEIRINLTALKTGRAALADAGIIMDYDDNPLNKTNNDNDVRGWVNNYYIIRTYDNTDVLTLDGGAGTYVKVKVQVYSGGDDKDGLLVQEIFCHQVLR